MPSLLFYLLIILILVTTISLFFYQRRSKNLHNRKTEPLINFNLPDFNKDETAKVAATTLLDSSQQSPYDPNLIVLQINSFPARPYMGYELHQALLACNLRFGAMNIFHRHSDNDKRQVLFSLAAATPSGTFNIEDMGGFKCKGLLLFMYLNGKRKLMASFDLMLDTARQLTEELGGEIYDDLQQLISVDVIKRLRERICEVETGNLYASDLLDNLD